MKIKRPKNWIEQRLTILTEIRNNEPERDWSVREVAEEMQKHELVQRFQPNYGKSSAHRDIALINQQLASKREELAESYIHTQLEITDELIDDLMDEYRSLTQSDFESYDEDGSPDVFANKEKLIKAKVNLSKAILMAQKRQASILPIDAPKKLSIESSHRFDIEHYYQIQQDVNSLLLDDPTVVDGDFEIN